jgi:hypothetical protein
MLPGPAKDRALRSEIQTDLINENLSNARTLVWIDMLPGPAKDRALRSEAASRRLQRTQRVAKILPA